MAHPEAMSAVLEAISSDIYSHILFVFPLGSKQASNIYIVWTHI